VRKRQKKVDLRIYRAGPAEELSLRTSGTEAKRESNFAFLLYIKKKKSAASGTAGKSKKYSGLPKRIAITLYFNLF
jgi:hypothetical protein